MRFALIGCVFFDFSTGALAQSLQIPSADQDEIVVHGRRGEQYRIPEALRALPIERTERWRSLTNRNLSCQAVGPNGCGTPLLPIFTLNGDGKVQIGRKADGN